MAFCIEMYGTGLRSLGVDPKVFAEIVNTSTGRCWSSDTYNPVPGVLDKDIPSNRSYSGVGLVCVVWVILG